MVPYIAMYCIICIFKYICIYDHIYGHIFYHGAICIATCGSGTPQRTRSIQTQQSNGGTPCQGSNLDVEVCPEVSCPVDPVDRASTKTITAETACECMDSWSYYGISYSGSGQTTIG